MNTDQNVDELFFEKVYLFAVYLANSDSPSYMVCLNLK